MEDSAKVAICRLICGTALLITHAVTGVDGRVVSASLFLLGIPFEAIQRIRRASLE